jgi:hypothetical protein
MEEMKSLDDAMSSLSPYDQYLYTESVYSASIPKTLKYQVLRCGNAGSLILGTNRIREFVGGEPG